MSRENRPKWQNKVLNAFLFCIDKWWKPILFFLFLSIFEILNTEWRNENLITILNLLYPICLFLFLSSTIYQFYLRKFKQVGFIIVSFVFIFVVTIFLLTADFLLNGDHYADDLVIPEGIQLDTPITSRYFTPKITQPDLILYNFDQPGIYQYDFWYGKIDSGSIYLKAFEITQNDPLSAETTKKNSGVFLSNPTDSIKKFGQKHSFTIYEGDFGKYYAARFEVWYKPGSGNNEMKIFEKNFKIQGWMH
ncbi:MAG: hypothetical protein R3A43_01735 [Bacteroidia bacterium]